METTKRFVWTLLLCMITCMGSTLMAQDLPKGYDGYYEISTKEQLKTLRDYVNSNLERSNMNVRLMADIDLENESWSPIGGMYNSQVNNPLLIKGIMGTFDGNGKTISNLCLDCNSASVNCYYAYGFLGYFSGTIKNLSLDGVSLKNSLYREYVSALCGEMRWGTISNCHVRNASITGTNGGQRYGGIVGYGGSGSDITIDNCSFQGTVDASSFCGGIVGYLGSTKNKRVANCRVLDGTSITAQTRAAGGIAGFTWHQQVETFTNCAVSAGCAITAPFGCGEIYGMENYWSEPELCDDGWYEIYSGEQLNTFSNYVNNGTFSSGANARLMRDIDMQNYPDFVPIASYSSCDKKYSGTFDGNGKTISNLKISCKNDYCGLFGFVDRGTVKDLVFQSPYIDHMQDHNAYIGTVCGYLASWGKIVNCQVTDGYIGHPDNDSDPSYNSGDYHGGICGKSDTSSEISGCYFQGKVFGNNYIGGIVGGMHSGAQTKECWVMSGSLIYADDYSGGICGAIWDKTSAVTGCFNNGATVKTDSGNAGEIIGDNTIQTTLDSFVEDDVVYKGTGNPKKNYYGTWSSTTDVVGTKSVTTRSHFTIYCDIGQTYNYFTRAVQPKAFSNLGNLKSLDFTDCMTSAEHAFDWINLQIKDEAFYNCPNFTELRMCYNVYAGTDHVVMLGPDDVYPVGTNAFVNCPNLKILVDADKYNDFINDSRWSAYKDRIVATTKMRTPDFTEEGIQYSRDPKPGDPEAGWIEEKASDGVKMHLVHVNGGTSDIASKGGIANIYNDAGTTYAYRTTKVWAEAFRGNTDVRIVRFSDYRYTNMHAPFNMVIGSRAFADCPNLRYVDLVYKDQNQDQYSALTPDMVSPEDETILDGSPLASIRVMDSQLDAFKNDPKWKPYADRIVAWTTVGRTYPNEDGVNYSGYVYDNTSNKLNVIDLCSSTSNHNTSLIQQLKAKKSQFADDSVIDWNGFAVGTDKSVYYIHADGSSESVLRGKNGFAYVCQDIGAVYNYRTVCIDAIAFRGNKELRRLAFRDNNHTVASTDTNYELKLLIEAEAFKGCDNLEMLDMAYYRSTGSDRLVYLRPDQVIPGKDLFDEGSKVIIRVGEGMRTQYMADANWRQYADRIVEYSESADYYNVDDVRYDVKVDDNGNRVTISGDDGHTLNLTSVGGTTSNSRKDFVVYTDIGVAKDYFTQEITTGAFSSHPSLERLWFADNSEGGTQQAYKWIDLKIRDYAFRDCKNFKALYMKYVMYASNDHTVMLSPTDVYPEGEHAFDGCDSLMIYVDAEHYEAFLKDPHWAPYANRIVSTTLMREGEFDEGGAHYVRKFIKDGAGSYDSEKGTDDKDVYLVYVSGPTSDVGSKHNGVVTLYNDPGTAYAYRTVGVKADAFRGCEELQYVQFRDASNAKSYSAPNMTIGSHAFAECANLRYIDLVCGNSDKNAWQALQPTDVVPEDETMLDNSPNTFIRVWPDLVEAFRNDPKWEAYRSRIVAWEPGGKVYSDEDGITYTSYIYSDGTNSLDNPELYNQTDGHNARLRKYLTKHKEDYASLDDDLLDLFMAPENAKCYYTHVSSVNLQSLVDGKRNLTIYNDIGQYYNYRTVCIDSVAFQHNELVQSIDFGDANHTFSTTELPLQLLIQRGAFRGCKSLLRINMIYHKWTGSNDITYLKPSQVIPPKEMFDEGQFVYICVAPNLVNEYKTDPNWAPYADMITPYTETYDNTVDFGVTYSYFPVLMDGPDSDAIYSNKRNADFCKDYVSLLTGYGVFDWSDILGPDNADDKTTEISYCQITHVDENYLNENNGRLILVHDIGASNVFKTISVAKGTFENNTAIQSVGFQDLFHSKVRYTDYSSLGMLLPDNAFRGCSNLKYIDMVILDTTKDKIYRSISPKEVIIGENAFEGCPDDYEIRVTSEMYPLFVSDPNWSRYRDHIVIYEYTPDASGKSYDVEGLLYEPAANLLNNLPTQQRAYMAWSLVNIPLQIAKAVAMVVAGAATGGAFAAVTEGGLLAAALAAASNMTASYFLTSLAATGLGYAANIYLTEMGAGYLGSIIGTVLSAGFGGLNDGIMTGLGSVSKNVVEKGFTAGVKGGITSMVSGTLLGTSITAGLYVKNGLTTVNENVDMNTTEKDDNADLIGSMAGPSALSTLASLWSGTYEERRTLPIYHMYIKEVNNDELKKQNGTMHIYNDIGSYNHYRTVGMSDKAARGNENIRRIQFTDCYGNAVNNQTVFQMAVPDSAFMGCTNLERLDMFMECTEGTNARRALGPENFILHGFDVFKDCPNLKVYVSPDRYEDFVNDTIWSQLDLVIDYSYAEPIHETIWGANYSYDYKMGSLWDYGKVNDYTTYNVHITSQDDHTLSSNDSTLIIVQDYGATYNYNTTHVAKNAFRKSNILKSIKFKDTYRSASNAHLSPQYTLRDSAFADCPNLKDLYMCYIADEKYSYAFRPSQVALGKGVFANSPNLTIKVLADFYTDYITDGSWSEYTEQIKPVLTRLSDPEVAKVLATDLLVVDGDHSKSDDPTAIFEAKAVSDGNGSFVSPALSGFRNNEEIYMFDEFKWWAFAGLTKLQDETFYGAKNLTLVTLPYTLTDIGNRAFGNCESLESLTIPDAVQHIGDYAFSNSGIRSFRVQSATPASLGANPFEGCPSNFVIYVPDSCVEAYCRNEYWKPYSSHIKSAVQRRGYTIVDTGTEKGKLAEKLGMTLKPTSWSKVEVTDNAHSCTRYDYITNGCLKGNIGSIDSLKVKGTLDEYDMGTLAILGNAGMVYLDLSEANFKSTQTIKTYWSGKKLISVNEKSLGYATFANWKTLETLILPAIEGMNYESYNFLGSYYLQTLIFPSLPGKAKELFEKQEGDSYLQNREHRDLKIVVMSDEFMDFKDAMSYNNDRYDLYCTNSAHAKYANAETNWFRNIYAPFYDDKVFRILAMKGIYNTSTLATRSSTKDWFTGSDIRHFDEFYAALSDSILTDYCFADCRQLESISLPATTAYIDRTAFQGCEKLSEINCFSSRPPRLESENVFDDLPEDYRIRVQSDSIDNFRVWPEKVFRHVVGFAQSAEVTVITPKEHGMLNEEVGLVLSGDKSLIVKGDASKYKKIKVVGEIDDVDLMVLANMAGQLRESGSKHAYNKSDIELSSEVIPTVQANASLEYLDLSEATYYSHLEGKSKEEFVFARDQFANCDALKTLILPNTLKKVSKRALSYCDNLKDVVLGEQTEELEPGAFRNSPRMKTLTTKVPHVAFDWGDMNNDMPGPTDHYGIENFDYPFSYREGFTLDNLYCSKPYRIGFAADATVQKLTKNVTASYDDNELLKIFATNGYLTQDELVNVKSFRDANGKSLFEGRKLATDFTALDKCYRVTELPDEAFKGCSSLKTAALPEGIVTVGKSLFLDCDSLQYVDWRKAQPGVIANTDRKDSESPFYGAPRRTLMYVTVGAGEGGENIVNTSTEGYWNAESFWRDDAQKVDIPWQFNTSKAEIDRNFVAGRKSTVYLPFAIDEENAAALGRFYEFQDYDSSTGLVFFRQISSTEAGKAYLFLPNVTKISTSDADNGIQVCKTETSLSSHDGMYGTWERIVWKEDPLIIYGYAANSQNGVEAGEFVRVAAGASVAPMRGWLRLQTYGASAGAARLAVIFDEDETITGVIDIEDGLLQEADEPVDVFTVDGRMIRMGVKSEECLKGLPSGIYIVHGKKVMVP